jgi:hypothetical protein
MQLLRSQRAFASSARPTSRQQRRCGLLVCASHVPYKDLRAAAEKAARAGAEVRAVRGGWGAWQAGATTTTATTRPPHLTQVVLAALGKPRNIQSKGSIGDIVTDTDKASEAACVAALQAAYPGHLILGEEGGVIGDTSSEYLWCLDPIDGTCSFAHNYPGACVVAATWAQLQRRPLPVAALPELTPDVPASLCVCACLSPPAGFCVSVGVLRHALPVRQRGEGGLSERWEPPHHHTAQCLPARWSVALERQPASHLLCALWPASPTPTPPQVAGCVIEFCGGPGGWTTREFSGARNLGSTGEPLLLVERGGVHGTRRRARPWPCLHTNKHTAHAAATAAAAAS